MGPPTEVVNKPYLIESGYQSITVGWNHICEAEDEGRCFYSIMYKDIPHSCNVQQEARCNCNQYRNGSSGRKSVNCESTGPEDYNCTCVENDIDPWNYYRYSTQDVYRNEYVF
jgi:hypothetical protein